MKRLLALLTLLPALAANAAQIWTVNSVADPADPLPLVWLNANTINTNVFAAYGTAWGDNAGGLWTFKKADATATNTVALGGPVESVNPLSPAGRWFKLIPLNTSAPVTASTNYWLLSVSGGITNLTPINLTTWQPLVHNGWFVGTNAQAYWGAPLTNGESFISARITGLGEPNLNQFQVAASDDAAGTHQSFYSAGMTTNSISFGPSVNNGTELYRIKSEIDLNNAPPSVKLDMMYSNIVVGLFHPAAPDNVVPWRMGTAITHTMSNLVEIANNGTNIVAFGPDARAQIGASTPSLASIIGTSGENSLLSLRSHADNENHLNRWGMGEFDSRTPTVGTWVQLNSQTNSTSIQIADMTTTRMMLQPMAIAGSPAYVLDTDKDHPSSTLVEINNHGTNQITFGPLAQIGFGTGGTNVLYLGTDSLIYTNASVNGAFLDVVNTNGVKTRFGTSLGGSAEVIAGAGHSIFFGPDNNAGGGTALLSTQTFAPVTTGGAGLGNSAQLWAGAYLTNAVGTGTNYIYFGTNTLSVQGSDIYWNQTKLN